ncbi:hypothetical protein CAter282_4464 [Collimonas arenae]|uniref:Uncharacterized protein n=1 Tax=Collimonas arenae TaxID=279058 RepID=A0A127QQ48_9BURK|nr:hypothetical protein CAter282_4464 [Collimonas arenae]
MINGEYIQELAPFACVKLCRPGPHTEPSMLPATSKKTRRTVFCPARNSHD